MSKYRRVELIEGEPVVFLAVHALRWPWDVLEPTAGFVEDTDDEVDALRARVAELEAEISAMRALEERKSRHWRMMPIIPEIDPTAPPESEVTG